MADSKYDKRQDGDGTVFSVQAASPPKNFVALGLSFLPLLIFLLVVIAMGSVFGYIIYLGVLWALWQLAKKDWRPVEHRGESSFRVSATALSSNGKIFNKDDIHRLIIRNAMTKHEMGASTAILAGNAVAPQMAAGLAAGQLQTQKIARVANSLDVEAGGRAHVLAGGMDEVTAFGLMEDVSRIIGFK